MKLWILSFFTILFTQCEFLECPRTMLERSSKAARTPFAFMALISLLHDFCFHGHFHALHAFLHACKFCLFLGNPLQVLFMLNHQPFFSSVNSLDDGSRNKANQCCLFIWWCFSRHGCWQSLQNHTSFNTAPQGAPPSRQVFLASGFVFMAFIFMVGLLNRTLHRANNNKLTQVKSNVHMLRTKAN